MARLKLDPVTASAIGLARAAAAESGGKGAVGEHVGVVAEGERVMTRSFACLLAGYPDWYRAVMLVCASRVRTATVSGVVLLPHTNALLAPAWVSWERRIQPGDTGPGMLMAIPDSDPRLKSGFAATDLPADADPAEWAQLRFAVVELGLGREQVFPVAERDTAAEHWLSGAPDNGDESNRHTPATCSSRGYFIPLRGSLGTLFGACVNRHSSSDVRVVSLEHGCGGHSDVVAVERTWELSAPVFDIIGVDEQLSD